MVSTKRKAEHAFWGVTVTIKVQKQYNGLDMIKCAPFGFMHCVLRLSICLAYYMTLQQCSGKDKEENTVSQMREKLKRKKQREIL